MALTTRSNFDFNVGRVPKGARLICFLVTTMSQEKQKPTTTPSPPAEERRSPPDLQALVRAYGGYDKITEEAWVKWDRDQAEYYAWLRRRGG